MRVYFQNDVKDCGLTVLQSFYKHFKNKKIPLSTLKQDADFGISGVNIDNLIKISAKYKIKMEAYEASYQEIKSFKSYFATIIDNNGYGHYVIVKFKNKKVIILDPVKGKRKILVSEFIEKYKNLFLTFENIKEKVKWESESTLINILSLNNFVVFILLISISVEMIASIISVTYMKIVLDKIIPSIATTTLITISICFVWLYIVRSFNNFLRGYTIRKIELKVKMALNQKYFNKLFNMKYSSLNKLEDIDYIRRFTFVNEISSYYSTLIFDIFHNSLLIVISGSILLFISTKLFAVTISIGFFVFVVTLISKLLIGNKYDENLKKNHVYTTTGIDAIKTKDLLRSPSYKLFIKQKMSYELEQVLTSDLKLWKIVNTSSVLNSGLLSIAPIALVYIGAYEIFAGKMTIGTMLAYLTLFNTFINPINSFSSLLISHKQFSKKNNMLSFIFGLNDENINKFGVKTGEIKSIELNKVTIKNDKPLFVCDYLFKKDIQIYDKNGIGKSTLFKYLSLKKIIKGTKVNGLELEEQNVNYLRNKIKCITSSDEMPTMSIIDYITKGNKNYINTFNECLYKYNLNNILNKSGINLNQKIIDGGQNFSSGQQQIIKLLTLFTQKFSIILLDEAFENIDKDNFNLLTKSIKSFQNSIFIEISHSRKYVSKNRNEVNIANISI